MLVDLKYDYRAPAMLVTKAACTSETPPPTRTPSGSQIAAESGLLALRRELRHEEIHVVSDSIANSMANHSHSIQPG